MKIRSLWLPMIVAQMMIMFLSITKVSSKDITVNGIELVEIPRGKYFDGPILQGSIQTGGENELRLVPIDEIIISNSFYLGKYEVSLKQWKEIMIPDQEIKEQDSDFPIFDVTFKDVEKFFTRLNLIVGCEIENLIKFVDENGIDELPSGCFRLPTAAEWEYARRGNKKHETKRSQFVKKGLQTGFSGLSIRHNISNYRTKYPANFKFTRFPENSYGLHNITGGVIEYCLDRYKFPMYKFYFTSKTNLSYVRQINKDPLNTTGDISHTIKGVWSGLNHPWDGVTHSYKGIYPFMVYTSIPHVFVKNDNRFQMPVGFRLVYIK